MRSGAVYFPGGVTGIGLLFLRFSVAASVLLLTAQVSRGPDILQLMGIALTAGLCAGLWTRLMAGLALLAALLCLALGGALPAWELLHALSAAALAMTGPGAFSADARLFGRRTITWRDRDDTIV